ncbi:hypothetical protein [Algoriphagus boseongensis]|uniref:hypothetical protein n=1 Tax=Algoriphagus boseongensis TaxID=1442587 RepID=UPI00105FFD58|nr:hypothetical protein [Algoriphagus boseongensis]
MKSRSWTLLITTVIALTLISFVLLFKQGKTEPMLGDVSYIFWISFSVTCILVFLTFLGSRVFPYKESEGK